MTDRVLRIYTTSLTPRLEYVTGVMFNSIISLRYEFITDINDNDGIIHLAYSDHKIDGAIWIKPSGLLSEEGIKAQEPAFGLIAEIPALFPSGVDDTFGFDLFAASFFMLSRYEEYLPFRPDSHGRFEGKSSLAFRSGFLNLPVVDIWTIKLAKTIVSMFKDISFREKEYKTLLTIDIDQAYAYKGRGVMRGLGGLVRDNKRGTRLRVITGKADDPYDTFGYLEKELSQYKTEALFFFLLAKQGKNDHGTFYKYPLYSSLIQRLDQRYGSGLHSSYASFGKKPVLSAEVMRYRKISGRIPIRCRQHWLLLRMPETYRLFISVGVKEDYTMGFADVPGFRAGIARPFPFYDLESERVTELTLYPFMFMDGTLRQYLNMTPESAINEIQHLADITRSVGGLFVSLWHNTSLTEMNGWQGWRNVFEQTLRIQQ